MGGEWEAEDSMRVGYAMAIAEISDTSGGAPVLDVPLDTQIDALAKAGCARIHTDTIGNAGMLRKGLKDALAYVSAGDTLVVWRLDRLSRSQQHLMDTVATLHAKGTGLVSLSEQAEITSDGGKLVCTNFAALAGLPRVLARQGPLPADDADEPTAVSPEQADRRHSWRRRAALALAAAAGIVLLYLLCFSLVPRYDQYTGRVVATRAVSVGAGAASTTNSSNSSGGTTEAVTVEVTSGSLTGKRYTLNVSYPTGFTDAAYTVGDNVLLGYEPSSKNLFLDNYDRRGFTFLLLLIFFTLIIFVARRQGLMSLLGMAFSVLVILTFVVPNILNGGNPLLYASLGALAIIPATYYLAHGLHMKTTVAIISTFATLTLTFLLAALFAHLLRVPFILSADQGTLYYTNNGQWINAQSLYLAALLIGSLAVLNDITISQASIVASLHRANSSLGLRQLVTHAMDVGKDHVASLVNTMLLVYIGASFTLFLTYVQSMSIGAFGISDPNFSADLLRTLIVSIGIVVAVPISTYIAAYLIVHSGTGRLQRAMR